MPAVFADQRGGEACGGRRSHGLPRWFPC
jgi:hypothetical protein